MDQQELIIRIAGDEDAAALSEYTGPMWKKRPSPLSTKHRTRQNLPAA